MRLAGARVTIVAASQQNVFFEEIEQAVGFALGSIGAQVHRVVDHFPDPAENEVFLVIPHEFLALTEAAAHPDETQLARTVALATEQPGSSWFDPSRDFCARAAVTLDINRIGVHALRTSGIDAQYLPLGYCPLWDAWHEDPLAERSRDVLFLGGVTGRREQALARCGAVLSRYRCGIHVVDNRVPLRPGTPGVETGQAKWRLYAESKILLNVHRSRRGYFEWQRGLSAIINGCVVVTDHSLDSEPLVPGTDFVSCSTSALPHMLDLVLGDDQLRLELQRSGIERVKRELPTELTASVLADAAERALETAPHAMPAGPRPRRAPLPKPPSAEPAWAFLSRPPTDLQTIRMALKSALQGQREIVRRLDRLERAGEQPSEHVATFGPYEEVEPEVSVVLTVFNYAAVVGDAIASVARSTHPAVELVIVDDGSRDDSAEAVKRALGDFPWVPARLIRLPLNWGLPAARNRAIGESRGEFVFILDADNTVYPRALDELAEALRTDSTLSFAYSVLERFDASGPIGLVSWHGWDPEYLRYGNFVDAMAMFRRSDLVSVGCYTTDSRLHGWEDFDLWCRLVEHGLSGAQVPNILGRYRSGRLSMISITDIDASEAWSLLIDRHPFLTKEPNRS
jgi:hypothetical protein